MIIDIIKWYLVLSGIGIIGFPIVFGFLKKLPGRGFVFSRSIGLILISFLYWLGGSLGLLRNNTGSLLLVVCVTAVCAGISGYRQWNEIREWFGKSKSYVLVSELVFLLAFLLIITI